MEQRPEIIYIIDDDIDDVEILKELIRQIRPESVCFSYQTPREALAAVNTAIPQYIFLSLTLPKVYGDRFLKELRRLKDLNDTYIVILATDITANIERMLISDGANATIEKPWNIGDYLTILKNIFQ